MLVRYTSSLSWQLGLVKSECSFYISCMARVKQEHLDARRQQILDAARRCFVRNGFHATSMQDILSEAELSAGGLYRYFRSKEEIIVAIAHSVLASIAETIETALPAGEALGPDEVLGRLFTTFEQIDNDQSISRMAVQVWSEAVRSPAIAEQVRQSLQSTLDVLVDRIRMYQAKGSISGNVPAEHIARAVASVMPGFMLQRVILGDIDAAMFRITFAALLNPDRRRNNLQYN
jgi:TetR/AcrR family transcriptional regulator, transcriptional repressor of aconitase